MVSWQRLSAVAVVGVLALSACSSGGDGTDSTAPSATSGQEQTPAAPSANSETTDTPKTGAEVSVVDLSESIEHIHGLVVTKGGNLVAGTHFGASSITPDGEVMPEGEQRDDLMGMTGETGTNRLASSGHAGENSKFSEPMGLITSDDAGKTWQAKSLQGEVDFHALASSGNKVIGNAGGTDIRVSSDGGRTWKPGARISAASLAFTGDRILATTPGGLMSSTDGGKTFTSVKKAPLLGRISAGKGSFLLGIDTGMDLWRSTDNGRTWSRSGTTNQDSVDPAQVQAIAAYDEDVSYAITSDQLLVIRSAG